MRVEERYVGYNKSRPFLEERRLNGNTLWLSLNPTDKQPFTGAGYVRGGYLILDQRQYMLPVAVEEKQLKMK